MSDDEIEAFADLIYDSAIKYANGYETAFRPIARKIVQASRRAALKEIGMILTDSSKAHLAVRINDAMELIDSALANGDTK